MFCFFWQMHLPKPNPCCITWSRQQNATAFTWTQTKWSTCALLEKELSLTLSCVPLNLVDKFTYLDSSVSSTESDVITKAWIATEWLSITWRHDQSDRIKRDFFQAAVMSVLLCGYTTLISIKRIEKKLDGNCYELHWTIPGSNTPRNNCSAAIFLPSLKPSK